MACSTAVYGGLKFAKAKRTQRAGQDAMTSRPTQSNRSRKTHESRDRARGESGRAWVGTGQWPGAGQHRCRRDRGGYTVPCCICCLLSFAQRITRQARAQLRRSQARGLSSTAWNMHSRTRWCACMRVRAACAWLFCPARGAGWWCRAPPQPAVPASPLPSPTLGRRAADTSSIARA